MNELFPILNSHTFFYQFDIFSICEELKMLKDFNMIKPLIVDFSF